MPAKFVNYSTLQQLIDKFISRYGTEKTFNIFSEKLKEKNPSFNQDYVIANIIANTAIELFKISTAQFKSQRKGDAYYARAACFRLIRRHTSLSYNDMVIFFNETLTVIKIRHAIRIISDILDMPSIDRKTHSIIQAHEDLINETIKTIP